MLNPCWSNHTWLNVHAVVHSFRPCSFSGAWFVMHMFLERTSSTKPFTFFVFVHFIFLLVRHGCWRIQRILLHSRLHGESTGYPRSYTDVSLALRDLCHVSLLQTSVIPCHAIWNNFLPLIHALTCIIVLWCALEGWRGRKKLKTCLRHSWEKL